HQFAVRGHGLGAHAGAAVFEVLFANVRHELLQGFAEKLFAEGTAKFIEAHAFVFADKAPESRKREGVHKVGEIEISLAITFAGKGEHSVGAGFDAAVNQTREVDAQKRKLRIGHRVNQMPHQTLARGLDF